MTDPMLKFTTTPGEGPERRSADERRRDFDEIYRVFAADAAAVQASRCSQCGVPFCQDHCPLGNNIPDWLKLVAEGRLEEAYAVSSATNNMPEVCGRICPQDRLCEGSCVIEQSGHGTVTIGAVENYITETAFANGWVKPVTPSKEKRQSVGVIGAGPAGLAAAEELRKLGFQVTVYDRYDRAGGLLMYGIPNFKLEKHVVSRRVERLTESGVEFRCNVAIGENESFDALRERHNALLIATGVYKARDLDCPTDDAAPVVPALDFLIASNRVGLGDQVAAFESGALDAKGKDVVVIGGGDTAMDCVRTSIRQGAKSVHCLYRRDRANMPGSQREVKHAEEEGVIFDWLSAPASIGENVLARRMRLGPADASGRQRPIAVPDSEFALSADLTIKALGFEPEDIPRLFDQDDLRVTSRGTLKVDQTTLETSLPGVFAAGDIVRGASLVVWAIRDGRVAAQSIASFLEREETAASADMSTPPLAAAE